jgi:hypothetical protein
LRLEFSLSEKGTTERPGYRGSILEEVETEQRPEWKDIADRSPAYRSYCAQWKSLAVRNGMLERHWESTDGRSKNRPDSFRSEQTERRADRTTRWTVRRSFGCQQDPE